MKRYSLRINHADPSRVDQVLGTSHSSNAQTSWMFELLEGDDDPTIPFVQTFLELLQGKYDKLQQIGVTRPEISVWVLYEYSGQCNLEFTPEDLTRLGEEGLALCVSCWEK